MSATKTPALLLILGACSLGPNPTTCDNDAPCRDAFGLGWYCADDGLCDQLEPDPRCGETVPEDLFSRPQNYSDSTVLGALFNPITDMPQIQAASLAVSQLGERGGDVVLVHCSYDEQTSLDELDADGAARRTSRFLMDGLGAVGIVGPSTSDLSFAVYEEAMVSDVVVISPSATSPLLTLLDGELHTEDSPGLFWRTAPSDEFQGQAMAVDIAERGRVNVAIVSQESTYGAGLGDVAQSQLELRGVNVSRHRWFDNTSRDDAVVAAGSEGEVQEVIFLSSEVEDIIAFLNSAAVLDGYNTPPLKRLFLADAAADPFMLENIAVNAKPLLDRIRGTRPELAKGEVLDAFKGAYAGAYGEDPSEAVFAPYTYDATWLALYGMVWSDTQEGGISGLGISRGIRRLSDPGGVEASVRSSSWDVVEEELAAGRGVNLVGASSELDFDPDTGELTIPTEVWVVNPPATGFDVVAVCSTDGVCF